MQSVQSSTSTAPRKRTAGDWWNSLTEEEKALINKKRAESYLKTYALKSEEEKQARIEKAKRTIQNWSDERKAEYRKNVSSGSIGKNKGRIPWSKGLTKKEDPRLAAMAQKNSKYMKAVIASKTPEEVKKWRSEMDIVMRKNGTFKSTKAEDRFYSLLLEKYAPEDVLRQYKDSRYPFNCDFYIKSEDLFIEINLHWTHGFRPYNPEDSECQNQLLEWQEKAKTSQFYKNAIETWTVRDVKKLQVARENNLNYKVIYENTYSLTI